MVGIRKGSGVVAPQREERDDEDTIDAAVGLIKYGIRRKQFDQCCWESKKDFRGALEAKGVPPLSATFCSTSTSLRLNNALPVWKRYPNTWFLCCLHLPSVR